MTFNILEHLDKLEQGSESSKYICPACGSGNLSINKSTGAYTCYADESAKHRSEIRNILAPLERWQKPLREAGHYQFVYKDTKGKDVVIVERDDADGKKRIWQEFPTVPKDGTQRKAALHEIKQNILPYKFEEAVAESDKSGLPIFVVEGELTCEALWSIGIPSITFLGGSKQYRSNGDYSSLFKNKRIVLCPDRDESGVKFMREVAADNPSAQWCYADPESWEWDSLPSTNGLDMADYIEEGADKETILSSIVSKSRHEGNNGKPSYEEILSTIEEMVGLYGNDARVGYEASSWMEQRAIKLSQSNIDRIIEEAKTRVYGKEEIETIDALSIVNADKTREWLIAGIIPLGSVMLLAASGGQGKTTLTYNWALQVALGQPWSGRRCMKGSCLLISADEPISDTAEKLDIIGYNEAGLQPRDIVFWETWRFAHMQQLEIFVRKNRPSLIVIDSLTACFAGMNVDLVKSNAGDALYGLRDLANQYRCSIVILHHLNKSNGLRDSSSFVDNVSEVVKLYRQNDNGDPNQFIFEWLKSRSGLTGKHFLQRNPFNYGWQYAGPVDGSLEELNAVINCVMMRKNERLSPQQVASLCGTWDTGMARKMLEMARRQGFITFSYVFDQNDNRQKVYHSWEYEEAPAFIEKEEEETMEEKPALDGFDEDDDDDFF